MCVKLLKVWVQTLSPEPLSKPTPAWRLSTSHRPPPSARPALRTLACLYVASGLRFLGEEQFCPSQNSRDTQHGDLHMEATQFIFAEMKENIFPSTEQV